MNNRIPLAPLQKLAWFNLTVFAGAVVSYAIAVPLLAWYFHRTLAAASLPSLGMFGLCGFWGFGDLICSPRKLDERETLINQRAMMTGFVLFWLVWVLSCMGVWAVLTYIRHQDVVPVILLPILVFAGGIVCVVTRAIATLVQYKRSIGDAL
jgi:uncharacterized integral membrane protein